MLLVKKINTKNNRLQETDIKEELSSVENSYFLCNFTSPKRIPLWQHFSRQNRAIINLSAATGFHGPPDLQPMMKINQISPFRDENCFGKFPPQIRRHPSLRTFLYGCFATKKRPIPNSRGIPITCEL